MRAIRSMSFTFFFQAEDGIRDLVRSRGLGDVYKRQLQRRARLGDLAFTQAQQVGRHVGFDTLHRVHAALSLIHI